MTTDAGENIEVYDFVTVDTLEDGDNVQYINSDGGEDYLENITTYQENEAVVVKGYSIITGDRETYIFSDDVEVGLWQV